MQLPKRTCSTPGCSNLTRFGRCEQHTRKHSASGDDEGKSKWRAYSKAFLRSRPICCDPFGRHRGQIKAATVTGHKQAHKGNHELMWDHANHYPLCSGCNAYQCVTHEGGFGNSISGKVVGKYPSKTGQSGTLHG